MNQFNVSNYRINQEGEGSFLVFFKLTLIRFEVAQAERGAGFSKAPRPRLAQIILRGGVSVRAHRQTKEPEFRCFSPYVFNELLTDSLPVF